MYQAKYGQFSLNDPFAALQRDSYGAYNPNCDEAAIKAMYNNQLSQVENLILQHQRAQQRLRQHLFDAEQQHAKVSVSFVTISAEIQTRIIRSSNIGY